MLASAVLCGLYARGGSAWPLGFVALVPWLRALDAGRGWPRALLAGWAMSVAFTAAVFAWFGLAIGDYTQLGPAGGLALLLLAAPLFQPQCLAFALVRDAAGRRQGALVRGLAAAAAWVATEAGLPKLLGDTLGHGLYPARLLRQAADLGGTAGLSLLLLLANEAFAAALRRWSEGREAAGGYEEGQGSAGREGRERRVGREGREGREAREGLEARGGHKGREGLDTLHLRERRGGRRGRLRAVGGPLALGALVPLALAAYGGFALRAWGAAPEGPTLRAALVQADLVDYERGRRERGAYAVVREVLDTHFAMSHEAVERQHVDVVLWSETVYPTTFGHPKSEAGAELDREILDFVDAAGVPFVLGTYDLDAAGEYNAAAFVAPGTGTLGFYRKTRAFPLTERVPAWLDGPRLRRWLPWAGTWSAGDGARVFPLRLADGREVAVLPLICLDDVDTGLGIDGARLGAQAIVTLSNDAWFTAGPQGHALHLAAAAFRSIETRLPQLRVTTNGSSAVIDATGTVSAAAGVGERALVVGQVALRSEPPRTLVVAWGDWVGRAAFGGLLLLGAIALARRLPAKAALPTGARAGGDAPARPVDVAVLPPAARLAAGLLRGAARGSLLAMGAAVLLGPALQASPLVHLRVFAAAFLAPELAAWCVLRAFAARAWIEDGRLVLARGPRRLELALRDLGGVEPWRLPLPAPGVALRLASGARWRYGLGTDDPRALAHALGAALPDALRADAGRWGEGAARRSSEAAARRAGEAAAPPEGADAQPPRKELHPALSSRLDAYAQVIAAVPRARLDRPWLKFGLFPLLLALPAFRLHQHIAYGSSFGEYLSFGLAAYLGAFALWWAEWAIGVLVTAAMLRALVEAATLLAVLLAPGQAVALRRSVDRLALAALYLGFPALLLRLTG